MGVRMVVLYALREEWKGLLSESKERESSPTGER
jgi:hypothetical protein